MSSSIPRGPASPTALEPVIPARQPPAAFWPWLRQVAATAAVVAALAGLGFIGHATDWTLPKFSSLFGRKGEEPAKWCSTHNVPEAEDIECNASLLPPGQDYGWCAEHGIAQCPLEHPDVAQLKAPPQVSQELLDRAARAFALRPRAENNSRCALHQRRVQFASTQAVEKAGVEIAVVQERPLIEAIATNGEVVYDETRVAHLSSRVAGTVFRVEKQVGDPVRKGDVLALVEAAEIGRAKSEFLQAIAQLRLKEAVIQRLAPLAGKEIVPGKQLREAEAALQEARIRLQSAQQALVNLDLAVAYEELEDVETDQIARRIAFLGLSTDMAASLSPSVKTSNLFPLRSPLDGAIISRSAVRGVVVDTTSALFSVADVSRMWLMLHVRPDDAKYVSPGQTVLFRSSESNEESDVSGLVSWVSTAADDQTRTVQVRVELPNDDGKLRANTFGAGRIVLRQEPKAIFVPSEAVHWDGNCHVAFVRDRNYFLPDAPKFFHVRAVRPGIKDGEFTEIIAGLLPGEVIASKNSVVLQAQLLKSNLGAGCCELCSPTK